MQHFRDVKGNKVKLVGINEFNRKSIEKLNKVIK